MANPPYECERFLAVGDTLKERFADAAQKVRDFGVAILPGVLNDNECARMDDGAWETAEALSGGKIARGDPATWKHMDMFAPYHHGLVQHHRWSHRQYVWDVRQHHKVTGFWATFYGCDAEDLLVSFDGIHFAPGTGAFEGDYKLHLDQGFDPDHKGKALCVQGWVTSREVRPGGGTLRCLPGSHVHHAEFADRFRLTGEDSKKQWYVVSRKTPTEQYRWFTETKGCPDVCIAAPKGSLVLWDSRTVHSGKESSIQGEVRNVVYVTYMTRKDVQERGKLVRSLKARRATLDPASGDKFLRTFEHWPDAMTMFALWPPSCPFKPRAVLDEMYGHMLAKTGAPELTAFGKRVAGLT